MKPLRVALCLSFLFACESATETDTDTTSDSGDVTDSGDTSLPCEGDLLVEDVQAMAGIAHCTRFEGSLYFGGTLTQVDLPLLEEVTENIEIDGYGAGDIDSLAGLPALTTVGGDFEAEWLGASYVDGLEALEHVGGELQFGNSRFERIDGLNALVSVWKLHINSNNGLRSLQGFENLEEVSRMDISWNDRLCQSVAEAFFALHPDATNYSEMNDESC